MSAQCGDAGDGILRQASYAMNTNGRNRRKPCGYAFLRYTKRAAAE